MIAWLTKMLSEMKDMIDQPRVSCMVGSGIQSVKNAMWKVLSREVISLKVSSLFMDLLCKGFCPAMYSRINTFSSISDMN